MQDQTNEPRSSRRATNFKMAGIGGVSVALVVLIVLAVPARETRPIPLDGPPPVPDSAGQFDPLIDERSQGDSAAPLTVYEVSDFQCPFCRQFVTETYPTLQREYIETGKIRFVFVNLPLVSIHPNAPAAHEFAMCSAQQDRFWPVHDALFAEQEAWARLPDPAQFFRRMADSLELDRVALEVCFESGSSREIISADIRQLGSQITSTPTFVIGRGILPGAQPIQVWRPILDSLLAEATTP